MTNSITPTAPAAASARAGWDCTVDGHAIREELLLSPFYVGPPVCGDCGATYYED